MSEERLGISAEQLVPQKRGGVIVEKLLTSLEKKWYWWVLMAGVVGTLTPVLAHGLLAQVAPSGRIDTPVFGLAWGLGTLGAGDTTVTGFVGGGLVSTVSGTFQSDEQATTMNYTIHPPGASATSPYLFVSGQDHYDSDQILLNGGIAQQLQLVLRIAPGKVCAMTMVRGQVGAEECVGD